MSVSGALINPSNSPQRQAIAHNLREPINATLHIRPLSARIASVATSIATSLCQASSQTKWHGYAVRFIAKALAKTTYVANFFLASVEVVALGALTLLAVALNAISGRRSAILQTITTKLVASTIHSTILMGLQTFLVFNNKYSNFLLSFHTVNAIGTHVLHIGSASLAYNLCHSIGSNHPRQDQTTRDLALDGALDALYDVFSALRSDFRCGINVILSLQQMQNIPNRERHIRNLQQLRLSNLLQANTWQNAGAFIRDALVANGLAAPANNSNNGIVVLNNLERSETSYQEKLKRHTEEAFDWLFRPENKKYLTLFASEGDLKELTSKNEDSEDKLAACGKEAIETCSPHIFQLFAQLTQLKEIESNQNSCPANFSSQNLRCFNNRRQKLEEAKQQLQALSDSQKDLLLKRLLGKQENSGDSSIENLFKAIGSLAGPLHQGSLMSRSTFNPAESGLNIMSAQNEFNKTLQEKIQRLSS